MYIGGYERLTQAKMEEFFRTDEYFVDATPGFFVKQERSFDGVGTLGD